MKLRFLSIIPILLISGCVAQIGGEPSNAISTNEKVFYNVQYYFNYEDMEYNVYAKKELYKVEPSNFFIVYDSEYVYYTEKDEDGNVVDSGVMENKFYSNSKKLFVFIKK